MYITRVHSRRLPSPPLWDPSKEVELSKLKLCQTPSNPQTLPYIVNQPNMEATKESVTQYTGEKMALQAEGSVSPEESLRAEVLEDDGEVFKANAGQAQFRALGM